jgi:threonine synthase
VGEGAIGASEDVVLILTGHVLKDGAYAANYHESAAPFANRILRGVDPAEVIDRLNAPA